MRLYIASCTHHYREWNRLAEAYPYHRFVMSWPRKIGAVEETPENAAEFWEADFAEVAECDALICFGLATDVLRGALVEAGYALALGKRVYAVGDCPGFGTWRYHRSVTCFRGGSYQVLSHVLEVLSYAHD